MITLKIPTTIRSEEGLGMTLYEASQLSEGLDITDKIWDIGIYFECPANWEEATDDSYDRFMLLLGCNIKVAKWRPKGYTICDIAGFMWENRDVFGPFFNENNREGYRPADYGDSEELDPEEDSGFYEAFMQPFESLLAGNYTDEDYQELYEKLSMKAGR